ncbi:MAG: hypothetical protein EOO93_07555 [Pedobacter sp.]|nr:MAG: hypothetical protein EOO93_07555 [Pedobacter sp.]
MGVIRKRSRPKKASTMRKYSGSVWIRKNLNRN